MPTKRRKVKPPKPRKRIGAKTRASDDALRERLRHVDLDILDRAIAKAIKGVAAK